MVNYMTDKRQPNDVPTDSRNAVALDNMASQPELMQPETPDNIRYWTEQVTSAEARDNVEYTTKELPSNISHKNTNFQTYENRVDWSTQIRP